MPRQYTKLEMLSEEVFRRKAAGETNREIAESYGLSERQIKDLVTRQNHKSCLIANGYVPHQKVWPRRQNHVDDETQRNNELIELRMKVEHLKNFLPEVGRK